MPDYTPKLNLPKPLGNENFNRANYNNLIDAIDGKAGTPDGLAQLGADGKVPPAQLPTLASTATDITVTDTANYYTSTNVEGALAELGQTLNGTRANLVATAQALGVM